DEAAPRSPEPPRAPDHGHSLPAGPRHRKRGDGGSHRQPQLFNRPHAAARARIEAARAARGRRAALRLHARAGAPHRAPVGAATSRRHILRRLDRESRRRASRRRDRACLRRGARSDRRPGGEGAEGRRPMILFADIVVKVSLLVGAALAVMPLLRSRSAALRHWVLAVALVCAVAMPLLTIVAPAWHIPMSTLAIGPIAPTAEVSLTIESRPSPAPGADQAARMPRAADNARRGINL